MTNQCSWSWKLYEKRLEACRCSQWKGTLLGCQDLLSLQMHQLHQWYPIDDKHSNMSARTEHINIQYTVWWCFYIITQTCNINSVPALNISFWEGKKDCVFFFHQKAFNWTDSCGRLHQLQINMYMNIVWLLEVNYLFTMNSIQSMFSILSLLAEIGFAKITDLCICISSKVLCYMYILYNSHNTA